MKLLIIGDLHGKKSNYDKIEKTLKKCQELAKNCDYTIFLGDLNDSKATIRSEIQELYKNYFKKWNGQVRILVGNHDYNNSVECKDHSLHFFNELDLVKVIDQKSLDESFIELYNNVDFTFIPYLPEDKFLEAVKFDPSKNNLFMHQDVLGAAYMDGRKAESSITPDKLKKYDKVFSGHIHKPQVIDNIIYVGTPFTESFSEVGQEKHVIIYDLETKEISKISLDLPKHVSFEYTISSLDELKDIKKQLKKKINDDDIVRVIINAPEEICAKVKKPLFMGINISQLKVKKISSLTKSIKLKDNLDNKQTMDTYLKQLDISEKIRDNVNNWNKKIMGEVK